MSLRARVVSMIVAVFALYAVTSYAIQRYVVFPSFVSLEREEATKDLERCSQAVEREQEHLNLFCHDWAAWNDTHQFAVDHNQEYYDGNLVTDTLVNAKINLIYIVDLKGEVVAGKIVDIEEEEVIRIETFPSDRFPPDHPLLQHSSLESRINGMMMTARGPMLVSSQPIIKSDNTGPIHGTIIMGRFFNEAAVQALVEQTRVDFTAWPIADGSVPEGDRSALAQITPASPILLDDQREEALALYTTYPDIHGKPTLLMRADVPRDISARGASAMRFATLSLVVAGAVTLLALIAMLQSVVVGPITRLTSHATSIGSSGDLTTTLAVERSDEIGILAREFDRMVNKLAGFRAKLLEVSRNAGMAEVASGVLHNVGNVLTSMNVSTSLVTDTVKKSRMSGLSKAVDLMREHAEDLGTFVDNDDRGKQLPGYLSQLAELWKTEQEGTLHELQSIATNLDHVNQIVQAQQSYAGATGVIEPTSLTELGNSALAMMDAALTRHEITVDHDVEETPNVPLDRAKMLQVLVNLLTNAKDAVKDCTPENRRVALRVRAVGDDRIRLEIADSGTGIAEGDLTRIFTDRYTTKIEGHGFGLHYSALAIKEMGGTITAQSEGVDQGATFVVELPMQSTSDRVAT